MSEVCPVEGEMVELQLGRVATQYREAARFKGYLAAIISQAEAAARAACAVPSYFDLLTAGGEQLTYVGKRMGFLRCHCVCEVSPVFGFACEGSQSDLPIVGFCEDGSWRGCGGVSDLCLYDDEVYRSHLLARRYQLLGLYDIESVGAALRLVWGERANIISAGRGRVAIAPGRYLTSEEQRRVSVTLRVLPIAPTMEIGVQFGTAPIAGFGAGWAGLCSGLPGTPVAGFECADPGPYTVSGFCDPDQTWAGCEPAITAGHWLCPTVIDPYACEGGEPALAGFDCGSDDGPVLAGFGDDDSVWAGCA